MSNKQINARITHKIDTEENWAKAINFVPLKGEWIIYDTDENNSELRLKIGDGITTINELNFFVPAEADSVDGYHFAVTNSPPGEDVTDSLITFVI